MAGARFVVAGMRRKRQYVQRQVFRLGTVNFGPLYWDQPAWSPTGGQIAFIGSYFSFDISSWVEALFTIAPDSTGFATIFTEQGQGVRHDPQWSPDGKRIVFNDEQSPGSNLRVVDAVPGGVPADLTPKVALRGDYEQDWSPDGKWVLFRRNYDLVRVSADGLLTESVLKQQAYAGPLLIEPDWQPCVAGVTITCRSGSLPGAGSVPGSGTGRGDRLAPAVRWLSRPRLTRRGRARVHVRCDERCVLSLHLTAKLRSGKRLTGPTKTVTTRAGRRATLTLAISRPGRRVSLTRLRRVAAVGSVKDGSGNRKSVRRTVSLAALRAGR
jgi:WD40-like Beta Propeller Repeat